MRVVIVKSDRRAREKPCLRCGLSLRRLLDAKHCPECGLSVWLSLNGNDSLDCSNPRWLGRLSMAAWVMAAAQLVGLGAYGLVMAPVGGAGERFAAAAVVGGFYLVVYHLGMLLLSVNERRYPDRLQGYRLACRVVAIVAIVLGVAVLARGATRMNDGWPVAGAAEAREAGGQDATEAEEEVWEETEYALPPGPRFDGWLWLTEVGLIASALATWAYLRKLAQRVPNSTVARACGYLLVVPVVSLFKSFPLFGYFLVMQIIWLVHYLPAVYFPGTAVLLGWFAIAFRRASIAAAESWGEETVVAGDGGIGAGRPG